MTVAFPTTLAPRSVLLAPLAARREGPRPLSGAPQYIASDAGLWSLTYSQVPVYGALIAPLRAFLAASSAGVEPCTVLLRDDRNAPSTRVPGLTAVLAADAAIRDTTITVTPTGGTFQAGEIIGLGDRLHIIASASDVGGGDYDLAIWPPVREAASTAAALRLGSTRALKVMVRDPGALAAALDLGIAGAINLQFEESY